MDLKAIFGSASVSFEAELALLRAALKHSGQKGSVAEGAVKQWLEDVLPTRLGVSEGIIVTSEGYISPQIDVIIYDKSECPVIFSRSSTKVIPIEFVYAVFEIKTDLTAGGYDDWAAKTTELKSQRKYFSHATHTYHAYGMEWSSPPILSGMFALTSGSGHAIWEKYLSSYQNIPVNLCVDICYINGFGFFTQQNLDTGLQALSGRVDRLALVKENPLVAFWTVISILATQWKMLDNPSMFRYGVTHLNTTVTQLPTVPPLHPDIKGG